MRKPALSIVMGVRDRMTLLMLCLESLARQTVRNKIEVIVVDYGGTDAIRDLVGNHEFKYVYTNNKGLYSRCHSLNIGIKESSADYILVTDADMIFAPNFAEEAIKSRKSKSFVMCHCRRLPNMMIPMDFDYDDLLKRSTPGSELSIGACQMAHSSVWEALSGYDEEMIGWGTEDWDMRHRMKRYGMKLEYIHGKTSFLHQHHDPLLNTPYRNRTLLLEHNTYVEDQLKKGILKRNHGRNWGMVFKKQLKLLIIGVDGLSGRFVGQRINHLPNLRRLQENSTYGTLRSLLTGAKYPHTGPCWSTIYTGRTAKDHGIKSGGWLTQHKNYSDIQVNTIWDLMSESYQIGLVTMPMTYPMQRLPNDSWHITGFVSPDEIHKCIHPRKIKSLIPNWWRTDFLNMFPEETQYVDYTSSVRTKQVMRDKLFDIEDHKVKMARRLREMFPDTEVMAIGLTFIDRWNHVYPQNTFEMEDAYKKVDTMIGELVNYLGPDSLIICSDHGFLPFDVWHDLEGYFLYHRANQRTSVRTQAVITDIAGMALESVHMTRDGLGVQMNRKVTDDKNDEEKIKGRLEALGYL